VPGHRAARRRITAPAIPAVSLSVVRPAVAGMSAGAVDGSGAPRMPLRMRLSLLFALATAGACHDDRVSRG